MDEEQILFDLVVRRYHAEKGRQERAPHLPRDQGEAGRLAEQAREAAAGADAIRAQLARVRGTDRPKATSIRITGARFRIVPSPKKPE